jgi:hypothetical protein
LAPKDRLTPELLGAVRQLKPQLLQLLRWDADAADSLLRDTLVRVERAARVQSAKVCERIADLLAEYSPIIAGLFVAQNLHTIGCALLDLERNVSDAATSRGYYTSACKNGSPARSARPPAHGATRQASFAVARLSRTGEKE